MDNPWSKLRVHNGKFVLACDRPYIDVFNSRNDSLDSNIDTSLIPEPFIGPFTANVVILLLNPGIDDKTSDTHKNPDFRERLLKAIRSKDGMDEHIHLDSEFNESGAGWWAKACRGLTSACESNVELARNILAIEFMPYHSQRFAAGHLRLPSQQFSFWLVNKAIERKAVIVLARGAKLWLGAIPELANYPNLIKLRNPRSASISERNLEKGGLERIRQALGEPKNNQKMGK